MVFREDLSTSTGNCDALSSEERNIVEYAMVLKKSVNTE